MSVKRRRGPVEPARIFVPSCDDKFITITPEDAFRGNVHEHGKSVERYRLDVIQGSRGDGDAKG